jgi:hypothetical protein
MPRKVILRTLWLLPRQSHQKRGEIPPDRPVVTSVTCQKCKPAKNDNKMYFSRLQCNRGDRNLLARTTRPTLRLHRSRTRLQ